MIGFISRRFLDCAIVTHRLFIMCRRGFDDLGKSANYRCLLLRLLSSSSHLPDLFDPYFEDGPDTGSEYPAGAGTYFGVFRGGIGMAKMRDKISLAFNVGPESGRRVERC